MIEERPGDREFLREVGCERFDAECFGRIMSAVENVDLQRFRSRKRPVGSFTCDECVHSLAGSQLKLVSSASSDDAHSSANHWPPWHEDRFPSEDLRKQLLQLLTSDLCFGLQANELAFVKKERFQFFETERCAEPRIVPKTRVRVQREVRTVHRKIVLNQQTNGLVAISRPGVGFSPKETVMDQQQIGFFSNRELNGGEARIDGRRDSGHFSRILDLQTI